MQIVAQSEMTAPGYLILADRYDNGWHAYVDDAEVQMARANGVERLVAVPAGSHTVRFSYAPFALYLGIGISVAAAIGWLGMLLMALGQAAGLGRLVRRRRRASGAG
jgi:uncharacterized membrane protein YfhO